MKGKHIVILTAALVLTAALALSGCSGGSSALPTLPPLPTQTPTVTEAPAVTDAPEVTEEPSPTATPAPSATPEPTATPEVTATPTATPTAAPAEASQPAPKLSISGETLPGDMTLYNVADLQGTITAENGYITVVWGALLTEKGVVAQEILYTPHVVTFGLAGTVNAELKFGMLAPGTYKYQVSATAENEYAAVTKTLIDHSFTVSADGGAKAASSGRSYTAKHSTSTSNEALIWNYFIDALGNPYGAAAILGNISTESGGIPDRVEGDMSLDCEYSMYYTQRVDSGAISREDFIKYVVIEGHGYGLCQWTGERKGALYDMAKEHEVSVGDLTLQCDFIIRELSDSYPELLEYLKTTDDVVEAACRFSDEYEQAAIHGGRTSLAADYLLRFAT